MLHSAISQNDGIGGWHWHGVGHCPGHFGELIQGMFSTSSGAPRRSLVSLTCRSIGTTSEALISQGQGDIYVPKGKSKVQRAVRAYCDSKVIPEAINIDVRIKSTIPEGIGMGSSTADIVSSIRALDQALGYHTPPEDILKLVMNAESACDSTMLCQDVKLFAQREGRVVENFGKPLSPLAIFGFDLMPGHFFKTDETPPAQYTVNEILTFDLLLERLRRGVARQDTGEICAIATESAQINQSKYPKHNFDKFIEIKNHCGALGICVSHSGTIAGLLFCINSMPDDTTRHEIFRMARDAEFNALGMFRI